MSFTSHTSHIVMVSFILLLSVQGKCGLDFVLKFSNIICTVLGCSFVTAQLHKLTVADL